MKKKLSLSQKVFRITREAAVVERKGVGENNGNDSRPLYAYPRIEDVLTVMQPLLNKYRLIATGSVIKDPVTHVVRGGVATTEMLVEWTLEDSDSGETRIWRIPGSGSDEQSKGSYRSLTGSRKYFYVIVFNLKFGDEPEEVKCQDPQSVTLSEL
jgi:ERF superfamily